MLDRSWVQGPLGFFAAGGAPLAAAPRVETGAAGATANSFLPMPARLSARRSLLLSVSSAAGAAGAVGAGAVGAGAGAREGAGDDGRGAGAVEQPQARRQRS